MFNELKSILEKIKHTKPLVLNLTNFVTMDFMANCLLSIGVSPIMSAEENELEELIRISHILNINIGTLDSGFIKRVKKACQIAKDYNKPIVLDPVGAGASKVRADIVNELLEFIDILKGNASEIIAIDNYKFSALGVDSSHQVSSAKDSSLKLSQKYKITTVISGSEDFITDGERQKSLNFGSNIMPLVTGTGCTLGAVIAGFRAINSDSFDAATLATLYFTLSGQIAAENSIGPGTFKASFLDNLYQPNWIKIRGLLNEI
jgi:hydroxyethylthiazole kinase